MFYNLVLAVVLTLAFLVARWLRRIPNDDVAIIPGPESDSLLTGEHGSS